MKHHSPADDPVEEFFEYLDAYLANPDHSVKALAEAAGISRPYLYKLKDRTREPTYGVAARLIRAMGGSLEILDSSLSHS